MRELWETGEAGDDSGDFAEPMGGGMGEEGSDTISDPSE